MFTYNFTVLQFTYNILCQEYQPEDSRITGRNMLVKIQ